MMEDDDNAYLIGNVMGQVDEQQINSDPQVFPSLHLNAFEANIDHIDPSVFIAPEVGKNVNEEQEISSSFQPNIEECNQPLRRFSVPGTLHPNQHSSFVGYQPFGSLCHPSLPFQYAYSTSFVPFSMQGHPSTVGFSQPPYQQMFYGRMLQSDVGLPHNATLSDNGNFKSQSPYQGLPSFDSSLSRFINPIYLDENSNGMNSDISLTTHEASSDNTYNTFNFVEPFADKQIGLSEPLNECVENISNDQCVSHTDHLKLETGKDDGNVTEYELFEDNCSFLSDDEDEINTRELSSVMLSKTNCFKLEKATFKNTKKLQKAIRINSNDGFSPKSTHDVRSIKVRKNTLKLKPFAFRHKNISSYKDLSENVVEASKHSATVFQCKLCDYCSNNKSNFRNHLFIHSDERQFACPYCPYKGKQSAGLRAHLKVHSVDKPYTCMYCPYKCKRKQNLIQHLRIHSKFRPFHCLTCTYRTTTKQALQKHCCRHLQSNVLELKTEVVQEPKLINEFASSKVKDVSDNKNADSFKEKLSSGAENTSARENWLSCLDCSYECLHREQMDNHSKSHLDDNVVSSTQENNTNVKHETLVKVKNTIFNCPDCEFTSARKCAMGNHVKTHEKNYFCCPLCVFKSRTAGSLRLHLNTHSRSRKPKSLLKCTYCEFDTFNPDVYVSHAKEHKINFISQKSKADLETRAFDTFYQCPYCAYDCLIFSTFKLHIANHSEGDFRKFHRTIKKKTIERPFIENLPSSSSVTLNGCLKNDHELEIANFSKPVLDKISLKNLKGSKQQRGRSLLKCKSARASRCAKRARLRILRHQKIEAASKLSFHHKFVVQNDCQSNNCLPSSSDNRENNSLDYEKRLTLKRKCDEDQAFSNGILKLSHLDQGDGSQSRLKLLKSKVRSKFAGNSNATPESMKNIICALQTVHLQDAQYGETFFDSKSSFENKFKCQNFKNSINEMSDSSLQIENYMVHNALNEINTVEHHGLSNSWESTYKTFCAGRATNSINQIQISDKEFKFLKLDQNFQIDSAGQRTNLKFEKGMDPSQTDALNFGGYQAEHFTASEMTFSSDAKDNSKCDHLNLGIETMKAGTFVSNDSGINANFHNQPFAKRAVNESTFENKYDSVTQTFSTLPEDLVKTFNVKLFNVAKDDHDAEKDSLVGTVSESISDRQFLEHNTEEIINQKSISKNDMFLTEPLANASDFESSYCQESSKFKNDFSTVEANHIHGSISPKHVEIDFNNNSSEALETAMNRMEKGFNMSEEFHFDNVKPLEQYCETNKKRLRVEEGYIDCIIPELNSTEKEERRNKCLELDERDGANEPSYNCAGHENILTEQNILVSKQETSELRILHYEYNDDLNFSKEKTTLFSESGTPLLERCLTTGFNPYCESTVEVTNSNEGCCERLHPKISYAWVSSCNESVKDDTCGVKDDSVKSGIIYNSAVNENLSFSQNKDSKLSTIFVNSPQGNLSRKDFVQPVIHPSLQEELMSSAVDKQYFSAETEFLPNSSKDEALMTVKCASQNFHGQKQEMYHHKPISHEQLVDYSLNTESLKLIENSKNRDKVHENVEFNIINLPKTNANYGFQLNRNESAYTNPDYEPSAASSNDTAQCHQKECSQIFYPVNEHKCQSHNLNDIVKIPQKNSLFGDQSCQESSGKEVAKLSAPKISIIKLLKVGDSNLLGKLATSSGNSLVFNAVRGSKTYKLNFSSCFSSAPTKIITSESVEGEQNSKLNLPSSDSDRLKICSSLCDIGFKFKKSPQLIINKLDASNITESCDKSEKLTDGSLTVAKVNPTLQFKSEDKSNDVDCLQECKELARDCVDTVLSNDLMVDVRAEDENDYNNTVDRHPEVLNDCQPSVNETSEKSTKYFCHLCNKSFTRKSSFSNHCKSHKKTTFKCSSCTFTCKQKQMFFEHQRTEHEGKRHYNCKKCDFSSTRKCTLMTHSKTHTNFFSCKVCTFSCKSKLELDEHYFTHKKEYECSLCNFVCLCTKDLYEHIGTTHQKRHNCTECSFKALTLKEVSEHRLSAHTKVLIKCHSCNYETNSALFLKFHMKKHLKDNIFLTCKECKYVADSKLDLYNHSSSHISKNDYKCTFCDDIFAKNSEFKDHLLEIHSIKTLNSQN